MTATTPSRILSQVWERVETQTWLRIQRHVTDLTRVRVWGKIRPFPQMALQTGSQTMRKINHDGVEPPQELVQGTS